MSVTTPLYRAETLPRAGEAHQDCGHRHRKAVHAAECLKRLYPGRPAHVMVSEDGGLSWQRASRTELREARHAWEEDAARRRMTRP